MRRVVGTAVALLVVLGGCARVLPPESQEGPQHPPMSSAPSGTPTATASVSASAPRSPLTYPSAPDPSSALDVSKTVAKAGLASFASPSGRIWCALYRDHALCHFPFDYTGKIPKSSKVCPDDKELDVTGVMVDAKHAAYFCSGDPEADPALENTDSASSTSWWKATGWPSVELDGQKLATVPSGKALVAGDFVCSSTTGDVTCGDSTTGAVFRISRIGVEWFS